MADKTKEFVKRRKELAGLSALTTTVNKNSPLNKLGPSGKFSSLVGIKRYAKRQTIKNFRCC
jgi:hypothetical protein